MALQHLRSSTAHKRPIPTVMSAGQLAINTNQASPALFFKDSNGDLVKVGPVHIGTTAPNSSPASIAATALVTGTVYQILTVGTTDFTLVGASANTVGTIFTATGTTTGTGTVSGQQGVEKGEQWLDTTGGTYVLKIYDGTAWRSESGTFVDVNGDTMTGDLVMNNANIVFEGATADDFETTLTVTDPTADRTITLPNVTGTVVTTGDTGSVTSTMISDGTIANADINASAEIAVSKLANGTARQLLQTDAAGTGVEFTSNVDVPGTLDVTNAGTFDSTVSVAGLLSADGKLNYPAGTAAAPSLYSGSDTDTGIYSPGSDQLAVATNGTEQLRIDSSGNMGLGISNPSVKLHVDGTGVEVRASDNANSKNISLYGGTSANDPAITFTDNLRFYSNSASAERVRIDSAGRLGLGQTSPVAKLDVNGNQTSNVVAMAALDVDCSAGNYFTKTIYGNSTFTFSNVPSSRSFSFVLELTHSSGTVTWPSSVKFPGDTAPTLTAGKTHLFVFETNDGGTRFRGAALVDYVN